MDWLLFAAVFQYLILARVCYSFMMSEEQDPSNWWRRASLVISLFWPLLPIAIMCSGIYLRWLSENYAMKGELRKVQALRRCNPNTSIEEAFEIVKKERR